MTTIQHQIHIQTTPEELYNYLTQPWLWHEWHPNSRSAHAEVTTLNKGDRFNEIYEIQLFPPLPLKIRRHLKYTVLKAVPFSLWEVRATTKDSRITIRYDFEPAPGGVRFTRTLNYTLTGISTIMTPWMKRRNRKMSETALARLSKTIENRDTGSNKCTAAKMRHP